jgi:hypothetical protein
MPIGCTPGVSCTTVRSLVLSLETVDPIPSGSILYSCVLGADTAAGHYALDCLNAVASSPEGTEVPATCVDGEIEVAASTVLRVGNDFARPGDRSLISVTLFSTEGAASVTADLHIDGLPVRGVSTPACVAPSDDVAATFDYLPDGCTPGANCTGVHVVAETISGAPFATGAVLFTCGIDVPLSTADGEYAVQLSGASGTTAGGAAANVSVGEGKVAVGGPPSSPTVSVTPPPVETPTPALSRMAIGSASGAPGSIVQFAVTLATDENISGVQNDLHFEPQAAVVALPGRVPDCTVAPFLDWIDGPEFSFQPPACIPGIDCTGIRALLITKENGTLIPSGAVLYTCNVAIDPGASGSSGLVCDNTHGSTPEGQPLDVSCTDGRIDVVALTPEPTATALPPTPTLPGGSQVDSSSMGGSGCQTAPASGGAWIMLAPLLLALRRRWRLRL